MNAINPEHYKAGGIETIEFIRAKLGVDGTVAYCIGNVLKYASRAGLKGKASEDLRKAAWYCDKAASILEGK